MTEPNGILHLRAARTSLVLDTRGPRIPRVLHWGADLGEPTGDDLARLADAAVMPSPAGTIDITPPAGLLPEHATGWSGLPGLVGHREGGRDWSPLFDVTDLERNRSSLRVAAADAQAALSLRIELKLTPSGLIRTRAAVRNDDPTRSYTVDALALALPVPVQAAELFDLTGRWARERAPQRQPFTVGSRVRETRRGRTGHDAPCSWRRARPASASAPARYGASTWPGAGTTRSPPNAWTPARPSSAPASC